MLTRKRLFIFGLLLLAIFIQKAAYAVEGGSISGTVTDHTGAVIPGASVSAVNLDTGVEQKVTTNAVGVYSIPNMTVGRYDVTITAAGFKPYKRLGVAVDVNSQLSVDAVLELGAPAETVTVKESALGVHILSTQLGDVIKGEGVGSMPLNGRSYTDLLALQPGVAPATTITSLTVQGLGQSVFPPSGDLNPGVLSIDGQRESANGYLVNGADAEETGSMSAAIIPNLDSIDEFRIMSDNVDAEHGKFTGGQISVSTKAGTNHFHGDVFDYLRNTDLDANPFFNKKTTPITPRPEFIQNQFGGTLGGPILRQKLFFFSDYQGTRQIQGVDSSLIPVPTTQDRTGNLSDQVDNNGNSLLTGTVGGTYFATQLTNQLGYPVTAGEPYYFAGCTSSAECVLPNATIPKSAWSAPAANLLQYIPSPNYQGDQYTTSAYNQILHDDKIGERIDAHTRWGTIFGYYFFDNYTLDNPYPTTQGGANVPGFNGLYTGRAQLIDLGDTKTLGTTTVNDVRLSYTRDANDLGKPAGGLGVSLASQGFVTGTGSLGIVPGTTQGVENIVFNNGSTVIGTVPAQFDQINNDFGINENISKVLRDHLLKAGAQLEYDQIDTRPYAFLNGSFNVNGTETGIPIADFLLGISSLYTQNQLRPFYERNRYAGLYFKDSWRVKPFFTLNYGLRWERIEPWYEKYNNNITFIPGEQSVVFPTAPVGIVYPGDPGVARTAAPAKNMNFAPRVGVAYSPQAPADSALGRILGGPGKSSVRAGFGIYYSVIPGESLGLVSDNPRMDTRSRTLPTPF